MASAADEPDAPGPASDDLVLRFSHHVIEHLGLKLYQNKPTNVIAELVSNGWDAGAAQVWVDISTDPTSDCRYVSATDDGSGMTFADLRSNYLVIGKPKDRRDARQGARYPMGRKGIGKLAPFGIASTIDVVTTALVAGEPRLTWIRLSLPSILLKGEEAGPTELADYPPEVIAKDVLRSELSSFDDPTGQVRKYLDRTTTTNTGTLVLLQNLTLLRAIPDKVLAESMGRRFTVTLTRPDFAVFINDAQVTEDQVLPEFDLRIPPEGSITEQIGDNTVKYWVGFVKTAAWPSDESGVGVYAHGKIAQDRPFTFGIKGREIFTRYMYGVIEADFLDELKEDVVSTDRTTIDWEHPTAALLYDWGQRKTRNWIEDYRAHRRGDEFRAVSTRIDERVASGELPNISADERRMIAELLADVTPGLGKDPTAADKVTSAVMKAYLNRPTRELLKRVWTEYSQGSANAAPFLDFVEKISAAAIPEALSLAVTFAQRAYALSVMSDMQHRGTEPDLQGLLETFPWILHPDLEKLTANQRLKTMAEAFWQRDLSPSRISPGQIDINEDYRPDFVFFSDSDYQEIIVVEIKSPRVDLTFQNREQLSIYMLYIEQHYPNARRKGYLVGTNGMNLARGREDIEILPWSDVFIKSRRIYVEMMAAMLSTANPSPDDARLKDILEFGGPEVWSLLERVAANDENLAQLVSSRPEL